MSSLHSHAGTYNVVSTSKKDAIDISYLIKVKLGIVGYRRNTIYNIVYVLHTPYPVPTNPTSQYDTT